MADKLLRTPLCDMLGIKYPILLAGMGGASTPELAAAVSNAGGLGILGAAALGPDDLSEWIARTRQLTDKPFGVDTLLPSTVPSGGTSSQFRAELPQSHIDFAKRFKEKYNIPDPDPSKSRVRGGLAFSKDFFDKQIQVVLDERVPVYVAGLGNPSFLVKEAHARGMKVMAIAGAVKHAVRFKEGGIDVIMAQGTDGGGHSGRVGTIVLVPQVVDAVHPTPVVAAGGIADGRGLVAALALGASGIWCGTPFLATHEAGIDDFQKEAILEASSEDAVISRCMTGKPVRQLKNKWMEEFEASGLQPLPMPFQSLIAFPILEGARQAGMKDIYPGIAGQSVGLLKKIRPAREIVEEMVSQAVEILRERFPRTVQIHA
ncbi:MAG: nitronate monooxygenase family protein [Thermodesulfobacteriota bacterium]|jgi:NAD(P)H-dependent flavin oxidoreductase YrpB (nitropropane dioxygenase family)